MSYTNYSLEVISHHPKFSGKALKQYHVDGINTVGAWGDEPFEICFKNNTFQKVQVKISLDGTDILTGKLADTEVSKDMWVVNGYSTLSLKAWPESYEGGAAFIFTGAGNSVAVHTHGDLSNRGIIAAAVFVEGHVEPPVEHHYHHYDYYHQWPYYTYPWPDNVYLTNINGQWGTVSDDIKIGGLSGWLINSTYTCSNNSAGDFGGAGFDSCLNISDAEPIGAAAACEPTGTRSKSLQSLASVGAGQYTNQHISYVSGLIEPVLSDTVRVKYVWWDRLEETLHSQFGKVAEPQPSGFPGDKKKGIDLKGTPRVGEKKGSFRRAVQQPVFARV